MPTVFLEKDDGYKEIQIHIVHDTEGRELGFSCVYTVQTRENWEWQKAFFASIVKNETMEAAEKEIGPPPVGVSQTAMDFGTLEDLRKLLGDDETLRAALAGVGKVR